MSTLAVKSVGQLTLNAFKCSICCRMNVLYICSVDG